MTIEAVHQTRMDVHPLTARRF